MSGMKEEHLRNKKLFEMEAKRNKELDLIVDMFEAFKHYPFSLIITRWEKVIELIPEKMWFEWFNKIMDKFMGDLLPSHPCQKPGVFGEEVSPEGRAQIFEMFRREYEEIRRKNQKNEFNAKAYPEKEPQKEEVPIPEEKEGGFVNFKDVYNDHLAFEKIHDEFVKVKDAFECSTPDGEKEILSDFYKFLEKTI